MYVMRRSHWCSRRWPHCRTAYIRQLFSHG